MGIQNTVKKTYTTEEVTKQLGLSRHAVLDRMRRLGFIPDYKKIGNHLCSMWNEKQIRLCGKIKRHQLNVDLDELMDCDE